MASEDVEELEDEGSVSGLPGTLPHGSGRLAPGKHFSHMACLKGMAGASARRVCLRRPNLQEQLSVIHASTRQLGAANADDMQAPRELIETKTTVRSRPARSIHRMACGSA